jgi:Flp pilus assembly protein TadG
MVEFALTAPVILILFLGLIEIGNGLNSYLTVLASARDAARMGAQGGVDDDTLLELLAHETERLPTDVPTASMNCGSGAGVCIDRGEDDADLADSIMVRVCYDHPLIIGIPGLLDDTLEMCSATTIRIKEA